MNEEYLKLALEKIPDRNTLTIVLAKRVAQLTKNFRPMLKTDETNKINIALLEIINDLLYYEFKDQEVEEDNDDAKETIVDEKETSNNQI